ncbi:DedA family protein [Herbiconiux sp. KACC 21604]|uniref:DedA family protein n=1 Tax=unclassified Herbiconiux TaxID=2618217 RepID=UPI0020A54F81|nr:DedA family protein [Herbiconiux sp. SALV-R1]WPO86551.1 DedA family protein [Herbiconiux sp. KACC 21604]
MSLAFADPNPFLIDPATASGAPAAADAGTGPVAAAAGDETGGSEESLGFIGDAAVGLMEVLGAPGAGLAVFAENLFPPIPSEVVLPLAGFAASRGDLNLVAAIVFCTLGSVLGALALYGLGAWLGRDRMRAIARRLPLVDVHDVDRTEEWFQRHGPKAVFFGRMLPLFRSFISIPAGIERMTLWKFLLLTAAGSLIWNTIFILAGFWLGEQWHVVEQYAEILQYVVIAAVVGAIAWFVIGRMRKHRRGETDAARRTARE